MSAVWDTEALDALVELVEFRARFSERASRHILQRLMAAADMLEEFPQIGRVVPEFGFRQIREVIVERIRLMYRISPDGVEILTLWNTSIPLGNQ